MSDASHEIEALRTRISTLEASERTAFNRGVEAAAKKCDEHAAILRGAEKRFTETGLLSMAEQAKFRAEQVEIVALDIRALPIPTPAP